MSKHWCLMCISQCNYKESKAYLTKKYSEALLVSETMLKGRSES